MRRACLTELLSLSLGIKDCLVKLEIATTENTLEISELINLAYRGAQGWTTERELVSGNRCSREDIEHEIKSPDIYFLIYKNKNKIEACISVSKAHSSTYAYIGSFAVYPRGQNNGLGKQVLIQAESFAKEKFKVTQFIMVVLSRREELIAYYERRGYTRNGNVKDYPAHLNVGRPLYSNQTIEELVKHA